MNSRGGCCIARYGGGGGGYDMSKVDRIMLRYRPIAPRPDSGGSPSSPTDKNGSALTNVSSKSRRGKRKYSKENNTSSSGSGSVNSNGNSKRRRNEETKSGSGGFGREIVTLPLLSEAPEKKDFSPSQTKAAPELGAAALRLSFNDGGNSIRRYQTELTTETVVYSSLLTVEGVTERWVVKEGEYDELGCTDEERRMKLERDTCPGFISDGSGRVIWTNGSYKDLVVGKDQEEKQCGSKMSVWLVMKEKPSVTYRTFTCRMRLQYTCRDKEVSSITSFCDVWRMSDGGFAWRLDVDAALCLGR
ncbi:PREDICTED: uncharacterized protein LOC104725549 [Camelina sativa]|uniref:Uncharacterized protein LOC104725549 n=1 Tax=Camelina sativa TaxID=90675 RepID=A0ABM0UKL8_CAMSA|nr:PREDICTED: uncharacterized protein LOC104725549 [Camelina sativa]